MNTPVRLFHEFIQRQRCNSSEYIICTLSKQLVHKNCQHIAFEILSMTVSSQNFKFFYQNIEYVELFFPSFTTKIRFINSKTNIPK